MLNLKGWLGVDRCHGRARAIGVCVRGCGCEMLEEDVGMYISFVYLLDNTWYEYIYIYLGLYRYLYNSFSSILLTFGNFSN